MCWGYHDQEFASLFKQRHPGIVDCSLLQLLSANHRSAAMFDASIHVVCLYRTLHFQEESYIEHICSTFQGLSQHITEASKT